MSLDCCEEVPNHRVFYVLTNKKPNKKCNKNKYSKIKYYEHCVPFTVLGGVGRGKTYFILLQLKVTTHMLLYVEQAAL